MFVCLRHDAASIEGDKLTNKIISNNTNATIDDTYITYGCGDEDVWKKHLHKNLSLQVPRIYLAFENTNCLAEAFFCLEHVEMTFFNKISFLFICYFTKGAGPLLSTDCKA